jgi:hypothetical protein
MLLRKLRPGDLVTIGEVTLEVMPAADIPRLQINAPLGQRVEITKGQDAAWSKNPGPIQTGDTLSVGPVRVLVKSHSANTLAVAIAAPDHMAIVHQRAEKASALI